MLSYLPFTTRRRRRGAGFVAAVVLATTALAMPAAEAGDDYPHRNAVDCSSQFDEFAWCVDRDRNGSFSYAEQWSEWGFGYRNCTDWVAWRMNSTNGVAFTNRMRGGHWSHANNWDDNAGALGYPVNGTPAVGAIAQTDAGRFGHVAWVAAVHSNGTVTVEDYNHAGTGRHAVRTVSTGTYRYIHVKDLPAGSPPFGSFDGASAPAPGTVRVTGWAIDADAKETALSVHVYVGGPAGSGAEGHAIAANRRRDDVAAAYPGTGAYHGFDATFGTSREGEQQICAYAIDIGGTDNKALGCKTVRIADPDPYGSLDGVSATASTVHVRGWTADPNDQRQGLRVHVYIGGKAGQAGAEGHDIGVAGLRRDDVGAAFPAAGSYHAFDEIVASAKRGVQEVCVYAINVGAGDNQLLSCATADLSAGAPHANGTFVTNGGHVYRVAGGAPVYVSTWTAFGGAQPTVAVSDAELASMPTYPVDGTFVSEAGGAHVYRIVRGAPVYVSTWNAFGGTQPTTAVDKAAIANASTTAPWNHLRVRPADGAFVRGTSDSSLWRIVGGAPYQYTGNLSATVVGIDRAAVTNAGRTPPWHHLAAPKDAGVWHVANGLRPIATSGGYRWGNGQRWVLACDTDGDGRSGPVTFLNGAWKIAGAEVPTSPASWTASVSYGRTGDVPVCGDWDGDGKDGLGVYRASEGGRWFLKNAATSGVGEMSFSYGEQPGDVPVVGDWDRDGRDEPGIYRSGRWYLANLSGATAATATSFVYGSAGDTPLVGDWDGDGRDGVGVHRASSASFHLRNSASPTGTTSYSGAWGRSSDLPVAGDWNADRRDGVGLVRREPVA